jgi:hypothetical protein
MILRQLKTLFALAAIAVLAPLVIVFVLLPLTAYLAVLDWKGKIKEPRDPLRDEWERWEAGKRFLSQGDFSDEHSRI